MKRVIVSIILLLFFAPIVIAKGITDDHKAQKVVVGDGDIYFICDGKKIGLTSSGRDKHPVLCPSGKWIYFVRGYEGKFIKEKYYPPKGKNVEKGVLKEELWRIKKDGTGAKMLFRSEYAAIDGPDPDYSVASIENIQFSPEGDKVYFETPNWVTESGINVIDADGSNHKLLGGGNAMKVVLWARDDENRHNNYKGYIVASQHRYYMYGPSYDLFYLFRPDYREIGILGDGIDTFSEIGEAKYTDHSENKGRK